MPDFGKICANGIDAGTGKPVLAPMDPEEFANGLIGDPKQTTSLLAAAREEAPAEQLAAFRRVARKAIRQPKPVDPHELAKFGWAVIFTQDGDPAVREALTPLLEHRRKLATEVDARNYREFSGDDGCATGECVQDFLERHGVEPGPADSSEFPYYLLLVGGPEHIPFTFQEQLNVTHAVGRLDFDTTEEFANYAASVVAIETGAAQRPEAMGFFGTDHDPATQLSSGHLVKPLSGIAGKLADQRAHHEIIGPEATKAHLGDLLRGEDDPLAFLFTASHGLCFQSGETDQVLRQGALVTPDGSTQKLGLPSQSFAAADVPSNARIHGLVAFTFACFGAATPEFDDFAAASLGATKRGRVAPTPFVAALPKRLLGQKNGALAIVGHVDRSWPFSFQWEGQDHLGVYERMIRRVLAGHTIGYSMNPFGWRYAALSSHLSVILQAMRFGKTVSNVEIATTFTRNNDARDVLILGDPAVRAY